MTEGCAEDLEATVNETVRLLMARTGKRQADVAAALGVTRCAVSSRFLGRVEWKLSDLPKVADCFGLTASELLSGYTAIAAAGRLPPTGPIRTRVA